MSSYPTDPQRSTSAPGFAINEPTNIYNSEPPVLTQTPEAGAAATTKGATVSHMVNKLLERAYEGVPRPITKIYKESEEEREIFMKYNKPVPLVTSSGQGYSSMNLRYVRYIPQNAAPTDKEPAKLMYPVIRKDLGFLPKLNFLQRFTQNVYGMPGEALVEEKDTILRSTRRISPPELKITTPESLEDFTLFKSAVSSEAFRR